MSARAGLDDDLECLVPSAEPIRRTRRVDAAWLIVAGLVVAGLGLRVWLAALPLGAFDGDEATTGLMVRQILHGHFYVYMAGQNYNGALEQYLQAAVWAVAPQNIWTLRAVDLALYVVTAVVVYQAATRYFAAARPRVVAVGIFCLGPYFNVWKGIHSHGSYSAGQLVAAVSLWAAAHLERGIVRKRWIFALGLTAGLSFWLAWTAFMVVAPACLWAVPAIRERLSRLGIAAVGFAAGAAPALGDAAVHGRIPGLGGPQPHQTVAHRLYNVVEPLAREFFGFGYRYGRSGLPMVVQQVALAGVLAVLVVATVRRRHALVNTVLGRWGTRRPTDVLLLVPAAVVLAYAASRYAWWTGEPRYLFVVYPALALGIPALLHAAPRLCLTLGACALALAALSSVATIATHAGDGPRGELGCLKATAAQLQRMGVDQVYSDYWTGMPLQLLAGDRLVVAPVDGGRRKFPYQRRVVDAAPSVYYLAGHLPDPMNEAGDDVVTVRRALAAHHITTTETPLACTALFGDFRPQVRPWQIGLGRTR